MSVPNLTRTLSHTELLEKVLSGNAQYGEAVSKYFSSRCTARFGMELFLWQATFISDAELARQMSDCSNWKLIGP